MHFIKHPMLFFILILLGNSSKALNTSQVDQKLYVSVETGSDMNSGQSPEEAFRSIQHAANIVGPGDEVIILPGIYFENVRIDTTGTEDNPIIFRAQERLKNNVIISAADKNIRKGTTKWKLIDKKLNMYAIPLDHQPARVLYDGVDLPPYWDKNMLSEFVNLQGGDGGPCPGPLHGYSYDENSQMLYVRLHQSGKYGSLDPNDHTMAVSPKYGLGSAGRKISHPGTYNIAIYGKGDAHIIIEGITFETPGVTGVATEANHVTVRHSWFEGCRYGVSGFRESSNSLETANYVTISHCEYHQYPAMDDMIEAVVRAETDPQFKFKDLPTFYFWHRKTGVIGKLLNYELSLTGLTGHNWKVTNCYIHDAFEGFSVYGVSWSRRLEISNNVFYNIVDNGIETENHARGMKVHDNVFIDVFAPLSLQPVFSSDPPTHNIMHHNVFLMQPTLPRIWWEAYRGIPTFFKVGFRGSNPPASGIVELPGNGIRIFNNTVLMNDTRLIADLYNTDVDNVKMFNNVFRIGDDIDNRFKFELSNNVMVGDYQSNNQARAIVSPDGIIVPNLDSIGVDVDSNFRLIVNDSSPLDTVPLQTEFAIRHANADSFAGALKPGNIWPAIIAGPNDFDPTDTIKKRRKAIAEAVLKIDKPYVPPKDTLPPDTIPPHFETSLQDKLVQATDECKAFLPDYTKNITINDNRDWSAELNVTQSPEAYTMISDSLTNVTITAADKAGNSNAMNFNVLLKDNIKPYIICPENQKRDITKEQTSYEVSGDEFDPVSVNDNCTITNITNSISQSSSLKGATLFPGNNKLTWTVTDEAGNQSRCSFDVIINKPVIIESFKRGGVRTYPNPSKEMLRIESSDPLYTIRILNINGQELLRKNMLQKKTSMNISKLSPGIYNITIHSNQIIHSGKLIIQ